MRRWLIALFALHFLMPKRLGQTHPEALARLVARPIDWLAGATKPFVMLLSFSTRALLRLLGVKENSGNAVTEEEIHAMLAEGTSAGVIESHEHAMVRNVSASTTGRSARSWCRAATWWCSTSRSLSR
jgi:CBS domain containing-hemolysin-like protein